MFSVRFPHSSTWEIFNTAAHGGDWRRWWCGGGGGGGGGGGAVVVVMVVAAAAAEVVANQSWPQASRR